MTKKQKAVWLLTAVVLLNTFISPGIAAAAEKSGLRKETLSQKGDSFDRETLLVKFKPGTKAEAIRSIKSQLKLEEKGIIPQLEIRMLKVPKGKTVEEMIAILGKNPNVEFIDPDFHMQTALTPNDVYFKQSQAGLESLGAETAWDISVGDDSIAIAVLDTGINASHEDLRGRITNGYNFINNNSNTSDDHGHGTMVAGILGAVSNNGIGIAGVTWKNPIIPVKVMGADGSGTHSAIAQGIIYAVDNGAQIINMSIGGNSSSSTLKNAVDYAYSRGVVMVAAAGNSGSSVMYPAAYTNVIAVGAIDNSNEKAVYSNYGSEISVTAPGTVISTLHNGGYGIGSGTSFAAPFVAGLAGLILSEAAGLDPREVQKAIEQGAQDMGTEGFDDYFGWGRINMHGTLASLVKTVPVITLTGEPEVNIVLGEPYEDAGASAFDAKDGDITGLIMTVNSVDADKAGLYTITYDVTNSAGIKAETVIRKVYVEALPLIPAPIVEVPVKVAPVKGVPVFVKDLVPPRAQEAIENRGKKIEGITPGQSRQIQKETDHSTNSKSTSNQTENRPVNKPSSNQSSSGQSTISSRPDERSSVESSSGNISAGGENPGRQNQNPAILKKNNGISDKNQ